MAEQLQIDQWREQYRSALSGWQETLSPVQRAYGDLIGQSWDQARYVSRLHPLYPDQMVICPPHSLLNMAPNQQHRGDYGTGIFEGSSAEPTVDASGTITGINVVLHAPRMARFKRSMQARGFDLPVPIEQFAQATLDIVAVHGKAIVTDADGKATRAYIRPAAGPGVGRWGLAFKAGYRIEASNVVFRWGHYLPDVDRIYYGSGARTVITGVQRTFEIHGKHASNYGSAAIDGNIARTMRYDELLYLAPYGIRDGQPDYGIHGFDGLMKDGVIADGPGEEVFGILADGATLVYPPMRVNRLGGTVLDYIVQHMAPALGLSTREQDITLQDMRDGKIAGLAYAGNAARIAPIGQIDIVRPTGDGAGEKTETVAEFGIHPAVGRLRDQWEGELRGRIAPSHDSLLTPVDIAWGDEFRTEADAFWQKLGF